MAGFTEETRVQIPSMVHLTRLGYEYEGRIKHQEANIRYDPETNILLSTFRESFDRLNPLLSGRYTDALRDIRNKLDNDDLGMEFYKMLRTGKPYKLIDFDNPSNNKFSFTGEFTCKNGEDEFRPDITLFINGLPLTFIEVKKPNNQGGMKAESDRMNNQRFPNKKFRRFINITQLMIFTNNMEYDKGDSLVPIQGSFYCTGAKKKAFFSCFREDNPAVEEVSPFHHNFRYQDIDRNAERRILIDFNCPDLIHQPEYQTNLHFNTPANRMITSMCSIDRILFLMHYGISFVDMKKEEDGRMISIFEKHIMRYQQLLASLKILEKLDRNVKSGIVWHTQGSGKTELSYYLNYILTDYFAKKNTVAKFYFIVDRLDLAEQAKVEFSSRGLAVHSPNDRKGLMEQFRSNRSLEGFSGDNEIVVVNIQKFDSNDGKIELPSYNLKLQRIFIVDEAHRGYNPKGTFLANLLDADKDSVKIALTGTPLLKEERSSWKVFGNYIHTYYYDKSIQDGYTLKIIREDIETRCKEKLTEIYNDLDKLVEKGILKKDDIFAHERYVDPLLRYIIGDLIQFRITHTNLFDPHNREIPLMGGMIVCSSSEQAKMMYSMFDGIQKEECAKYGLERPLKAALILHDSEDKEEVKKIEDNFRHKDDYDFLIVFNMLLTGFDAPRLKRLYLGRELKDHSLLQAVTRVNRPYSDMRYGYVVDFVDIKENFDDTNRRYMEELNRFNNVDPEDVPDGSGRFIDIFESKEEIIRKMKKAQSVLYPYNTENAELFSREISSIEDKKTLIEMRTSLEDAKDCSNIVRSFGDRELMDIISKLMIEKLPILLAEVQRRIDLINSIETLERSDSTAASINNALYQIEFEFKKRGEEELRILTPMGPLNEELHKVANAIQKNLDEEDPEYITIREALQKRFREHGFTVESESEYDETLAFLQDVLVRMNNLNNRNANLLHKYNEDVKFARVHKRIKAENERRKSDHGKAIISEFEPDIETILRELKGRIDLEVYAQSNVLEKEGYFERMVMSKLMNVLKDADIDLDRADREFIRRNVVDEYFKQHAMNANGGALA